MWLTALITAGGAYLIGSVNFAVIFTKLFADKDVRDFGSGNAGTTNVMRVGGKTAGILTFVCDMLKGYLSCVLGEAMFKYIAAATGEAWAVGIYGAYICGVFCILGHVFPLFFDFKGGKGVATGAGIFAFCCPIAVAAGLLIFVVIRLISKIVSISSLIAALTVFLVSVFFYDETVKFWPQALCGFIIIFIVFFRHKDNILRLVSGEEKKMGFKR